MNPHDRENDHPASFSLCPMRLSRGNVIPYPHQGTETKVAELSKRMEVRERGASFRDIPYSSEKDTKQGSEQCGRCDSAEGHTQDADENELELTGLVCPRCVVCTHRGPLR